MRTAALTLALALLAPSAQADPLVDVVEMAGARVTLDGVLREWSGTMLTLDDRVQLHHGAAAWSGPDDASMSFVVARDADALYVAAEVRDDRVVRTRQHRATDDKIVLTMAFPTGRLWRLWEIELQPGEPGSYPGAVRYRAPRVRAVPGAQIVEAPSRGGFTVEARVPWGAMPGLRDNLASARIRVAYEDSDQEAHPVIESVIANGGGDLRRPQDLPPTESAAPALAMGAVDLLARFRTERGVAGSVRPILDRRGNLTGTPEPERIVVFPGHAVAFGPGIAGGSNYTFLAFAPGEVESAQAIDLTGDRRLDLAVTLRAAGGGFERTLLRVYTLNAGGGFDEVFVRELGRREGARRLMDSVRYQGTRISVGLSNNQGFTRETWPTAVEAGVEAPLTPWSPHRAETWNWEPTRRSFVLERSENNPVAAVDRETPSVVDTPSNEPAEPTEDVAGVLRLFREREHLPAGAQPSFRATGDAAEDATPEQFYVYGLRLVTVGRAFMGGRAYSSITLPASEGDTVLGLRAVDITDDGRVEAVVTVRRAVSAQVRGQTVASTRDMVFAYSFEATHRGRVFSAEVARRVGEDSIVNELVLPRGGRGSEVTVRAGAVRGWTEASYPFHDAAPTGYEALLLPWGAARAVTYRWNGRAMARVP